MSRDVCKTGKRSPPGTMNPRVRPRPKVDYRVPWAHGVKLGVLPESLRRGSPPGVVVAGGPRGSGTHGCWETALPLPTARVSHAGGGLALAVAAGSGSAKPATKQGSRLGRGRVTQKRPAGRPGTAPAPLGSQSGLVVNGSATEQLCNLRRVSHVSEKLRRAAVRGPRGTWW